MKCENVMSDQSFTNELNTGSLLQSLCIKLPIRMQIRWLETDHIMHFRYYRRVGFCDFVSFIRSPSLPTILCIALQHYQKLSTKQFQRTRNSRPLWNHSNHKLHHLQPNLTVKMPMMIRSCSACIAAKIRILRVLQC